MSDTLTIELSEQDVLEITLDRALLPYSYYEFFKSAWSLVEQDPFVDSWAIKYICDRLQAEVERIADHIARKKHLIINIPPRFGKSNMVTVFLNAWCWIRFPHIRFISVSYNDSLTEEHSMKTKDIIESDWYQHRFGTGFRMSKRKNTNKIFKNTRGGSRTATTPRGGITGKGADIFIVDDGIDPQKATSDVERKRTNTWFGRVAKSRLNRASIGLFIIVQQRVHEMDLVGYVTTKNPENWEKICLPATDTYPVEPAELKAKYIDGLLDPVRFPYKVLAEIGEDMLDEDYACQYGQQSKALEGNVIKGAWLQVITFQQYLQRAGQFRPQVDFFVDTAYTEEDRNDPSAIGAMVFFGNCLYILRVENKRMELPALVEFLPRFAITNGYDGRSLIYIEPKASGLSIYQTIKSSTALNVVKGEPPKGSKMERVNACGPFMKSGRVYLVDGAWTEGYISQLTGFPNSAHDDMVDITTMAIQKYSKPKRTVS